MVVELIVRVLKLYSVGVLRKRDARCDPNPPL